MTKKRMLLWVGPVVIAAGCAAVPKYERPAAPVPTEWPAGLSQGTNATDAAELGWRDFFADPDLRQVIETALLNNRDLRLAALNVERAQALYGIQRAERWPVVNAAGIASWQRTPADLSKTGAATSSEREDINIGVAAWELDFFGRLRHLRDRSLKEYLATEQARRSAQIVLVAGVANTYLTLAADRDRLALAESTLESLEKAYKLVKRSYDLGLAPEVDLYRAQAQRDAALGETARCAQLVAQDTNALNLLVGAPVDVDLIPRSLSDVGQPHELIPGLSSEVLLRRPDVLQAENLLKAADADIGAARASLFPRISLTTSIGTASSELSGLFTAGSDAWLFAPRISLPVFDARSWSTLKATKVQRNIVLTQYEKAIQTAFREVSDALAVRGSIGRQVTSQQSVVDAVSQTQRLSTVRYERGLDSYLGVLDAQRSLYVAQQVLVTLRLAQHASLVRLYAVLGGGAEN